MDFSANLLEWYYKNYRKLPWRETSDPYAIWLSEVMLQQTQVDTVIHYYNRFLKALPTVRALAEAPEDAVYKLWEGLGYYSRAKNLMQCAKTVMSTYQGEFPKTYDALLALPGIGPYTAGAILSIAYNLPYPAVDGNVMRVLSRVFNMREDISQSGTRSVFEKKIMTLLPEDRRHFNQGLMELGATICTPRNPNCSQCPLENQCQATVDDLWKILPIKSKKPVKRKVQVAVAYINCEHQILITKKPEEGLLGGLWGFPYIEYEKGENFIDQLKDSVKENFDLKIQEPHILKTAKHVFTHIIWEITFIRFQTKELKFVDFPTMTWVSDTLLMAYPLPTAFRKLIDKEIH